MKNLKHNNNQYTDTV